MLQMTINEKGGPSRTESFDKTEVTIGRVQGNDIILPKGNISKRHSRIVLKDGKFIIVDLKSTNGTYVNGKKITAPQVIKASDKVYIGDFTIQIDHGQNGVEEPLPRGRSIPGAEEEIDLFGGDAGFDGEAEAARPAGPGLIDENFDKEFVASESESKARLPQPSKRAATRRPEQESELELDEDFGDGGEAESASMELEDSFEPDVAVPSVAEEPPPEAAPKSAVAPDMEVTPSPGVEARSAPTSVPSPSPVPVAPAVVSTPAVVHASAIPPLEPEDRDYVVAELQRAILRELDLSGRSVESLPGLRESAQEVARARLEAYRGRLPPGENEEALVQSAVSRTVGIDELADLLADDSVFEVVVTPERQIMVDREGRLEPSGRVIESEGAVISAIHALATLSGIDPESVEPLIDIRLRSGARLLASLPPAAFRGPSLTVRKTTRDFFTLQKLEEYDTIDKTLLALLEAAVRYRRTILLSMGPGVSGTATLNALLSQMPTDDRIVTMERGVELHLRGHSNAIAFELQDGVEMQDILRYATAAQSDRLLLGELTSADASAVVRAFGASVDGSAAAIAAASAEDAYAKLVDWLMMDNGGREDEARRSVAQAFPLILQEQKLTDNSRRITQVSELVVEDGEARLEHLLRFEPSGVDESMMITGSFVPVGRVPTFLKKLVERGEAQFDLSAYGAS